jgi:hypothetical protein
VTIRITIKNHGSEKQIVGVQEFNRLGDKTTPMTRMPIVLKGGEEREITIWDTKYLEVFEIANG